MIPVRFSQVSPALRKQNGLDCQFPPCISVRDALWKLCMQPTVAIHVQILLHQV